MKPKKYLRLLWRVVVILIFAIPFSFMSVGSELGYQMWQGCEAAGRWLYKFTGSIT